jgi:Zn-finger domain-containing protein
LPGARPRTAGTRPTWRSRSIADSAKILAQTRRKLNLALTDATYERALRERYSREIRVPVTAKPEYVKVIVYDYEADRVGSALARVK